VQAARAAAMLRNEFGIEATIESAPYGTLQVLVDDELVVDSGALAFMGVVPTLREIRDKVAARIAHRPNA
jgi:hypothetical protein